MTGTGTPHDTTKREGEPWEKRHENDGRGPLADNPSLVPDRDADIPEGTPGEAGPVAGDGFQRPSGAVHPTFPDQDSGNTAGQGSPGQPGERGSENDETGGKSGSDRDPKGAA